MRVTAAGELPWGPPSWDPPRGPVGRTCPSFGPTTTLWVCDTETDALPARLSRSCSAPLWWIPAERAAPLLCDSTPRAGEPAPSSSLPSGTLLLHLGSHTCPAFGFPLRLVHPSFFPPSPFFRGDNPCCLPPTAIQWAGPFPQHRVRPEQGRAQCWPLCFSTAGSVCAGHREPPPALSGAGCM